MTTAHRFKIIPLHSLVIALRSFFLILIFSLPTTAKEVEETIYKEAENVKHMPRFGKGQFLLVPIPMSNPTLGTGLQLATLYLHPEKPGSPNTTSALGLMYTNTDSWAAGIFHDDYFFQDRLRIRGAILTSELNIEYYGTGSDPAFSDNPVDYQLASDLVMLQVLSRVPATQNWFAGIRLLNMQATVAFDPGRIVPGLPVLENAITINNIALVTNYDSRDNNYYPTNGQFFEASRARNDESWGSDYNFDRYSLDYNHYLSISPNNVLAVRLNAVEVDGDAPFFILPRLQLRGFPSGRYQDNAAISAHLEWRHKFNQRWGIMSSLESGSIGNSVSEAIDNERVTSIGLGLRWQVSTEKPMHLGVDVGFSEGEHEHAVYIQVGEKF